MVFFNGRQGVLHLSRCAYRPLIMIKNLVEDSVNYFYKLSEDVNQWLIQELQNSLRQKH